MQKDMEDYVIEYMNRKNKQGVNTPVVFNLNEVNKKDPDFLLFVAKGEIKETIKNLPKKLFSR